MMPFDDTDDEHGGGGGDDPRHDRDRIHLLAQRFANEIASVADDLNVCGECLLLHLAEVILVRGMIISKTPVPEDTEDGALIHVTLQGGGLLTKGEADTFIEIFVDNVRQHLMDAGVVK